MYQKRNFIVTITTILLAAFLFGQVSAVHAQAAPITFDNMTRLSPNGQKVVSVTATDWNMTGSAIHLANANGTQDTVLVAGDSTGITYWVTNPVWSPDSQEIAYMKVVLVDLTTFANYRYELWAIEINGSNNRLLNNTLFHPAIGYGGKTDFLWNAANEIEFPDRATYPPKKYAVKVDPTLAIREIEMVGGMSEPPSTASVEAVPAYWQADPRWGSDRLGDGEGACAPNYTLASSGSAVTASAMSISSLADSHLDPGEENAQLGSSAFTGDCLLVWQTLATYYHSIEDTNLLHPQQSDPAYMNQWRDDVFDTMRSKVDEGYPVMLWYYTSAPNVNFLVVTSYDGTTITANDPSTGNTITRDFYAASNYIRGMVYLMQEPPTFPKTGPEDDSEDIDPRDVTLSWDAVSPTPQSYRYCLHTTEEDPCDDQDPNNQDWTGVGLNTQVSRNDLQGNTTYTWQVQANYGPDQKLGANLNVGWTFTTGPLPMVTISGNAGIAYATLKYNDGGPQQVAADEDGFYTISVPVGWYGTVTPEKLNVTFTLPNTTYEDLQEDMPNQNYIARVKITGNTGAPYVLLSYSGGSVTSDINGNYTIPNLLAGWDNTVTPTLTGVVFVPASRDYDNLQESPSGQNYAPKVQISGNAGTDNAEMYYEQCPTENTCTFGGPFMSAANGSYTLTVPWGLPTKVEPFKPDMVFTPPNRDYGVITSHQTGQNYTAAPYVPPATYTITGNVGIGGVTLFYTVPQGQMCTCESYAGTLGNYSITVPSDWTGTITPVASGVEFSPPSLTFNQAVNGNITGQNFVPTFVSLGSDDGWILQGASINSVANVFRIGDDATNKPYRAMLSFDTSGLPNNATITSATLKIKQYSAPIGDNPFLETDWLWAYIRTGFFGTSSALELGDFNAITSGLAGKFDETSSGGWYSNFLTPTGISYINKTGLTQFRLNFGSNGDTDDQSDYISFYSGNFSLHHPQLVITYTIP